MFHSITNNSWIQYTESPKLTYNQAWNSNEALEPWQASCVFLWEVINYTDRDSIYLTDLFILLNIRILRVIHAIVTQLVFVPWKLINESYDIYSAISGRI